MQSKFIRKFMEWCVRSKPWNTKHKVVVYRKRWISIVLLWLYPYLADWHYHLLLRQNRKDPLGLEDPLLYTKDTSVRAINTISFWRDKLSTQMIINCSYLWLENFVYNFPTSNEIFMLNFSQLWYWPLNYISHIVT